MRYSFYVWGFQKDVLLTITKRNKNNKNNIETEKNKQIIDGTQS